MMSCWPMTVISWSTWPTIRRMGRFTLWPTARVIASRFRSDQALVGVAGIDDVLLADDGDFLVHLADDQTDGQIHPLAHGEGDRLALQGLETVGNDLDGVDAGLQQGNGIKAIA